MDWSAPRLHDNHLGGFSADGTEYILRLRPDEDGKHTLPPMPWVNIVSNERAGFIVSETGAGYTWAGNSRLNRLTPWHNDPVCDPHGEAIYLRDEDAKTYWSPTPGPVRQPVEYEVCHGFGYTCFRHVSNEFFHETTQFVPCDRAIKITWVRLTNRSDRVRRLRLFSFHHWDLTDGDRASRAHTITTIDTQLGAVFATNNQRGVFADHCSFASLMPPPGAGPVDSTADRTEFLGPQGDLAVPCAVRRGEKFSGRAGEGFDACAAHSVELEVGPGDTVEFAVILGEAAAQAEAAALLQQFQSPESWSTALGEVKAFWSDRLTAVQIHTPSSALDLMVNGWLTYQNLSCRMWGRSATYQSGGAYGYRDQLQDSAALIHHWPKLTRDQILRHAAHQFVEGDVMHWWHPPLSLGIRTMFSDDLLWLPLFAAEYVETTGDEAIWQEQIPFLTGAKVPAGEPEILLTPTQSDESGTLYEHCCRSLDRGLTAGRHGLPLMGCGDWNDGMNRVGIGGSGESVWLGFFIDTILAKMLPICERFADHQRWERYSTYREQLRAALNDAGWDGGWYRRAYFDDGTPMGSAAADECQIDALVQAWAVLSGAAPAERAEKAMQAATERLVDREAGMIKLLDPPFDQMAHDPGYIKGYVPGVRENGGQYTHGVLWFIRAVAELGQGSKAVELLEMLTPIRHTRTPAEVATYQTEPYVVAADVYGQPPHVGRGGWSWYTGSAGWMWRVAVESILGFGIEAGKTLCIDPRISSTWPEYSISYRLPDGKTCYAISVSNPAGKESGVSTATLDGEAAPVVQGVARIPLSKDGKSHSVEILL
jgi:cyclic beta-1,2-glucan synthetase